MQRYGWPFEGLSPSSYRYMMKLRKFYPTPYALLCSSTLSLPAKKHLLKKWRDDRTKFIYENCRDYDYTYDDEMDEILKMVSAAKAIATVEEKISTEINIYLAEETHEPDVA